MNEVLVTIKFGDIVLAVTWLHAIIAAAIVATLLFMILMASFNKKPKKDKGVYKITQWQKRNLPISLNYVSKEIDNGQARQYCEDHTGTIEKFLLFLSRQSVWNTRSLENKVGSDADYVLSRMFFYDIESCLTEYVDETEKALLLCHSVDMLNGGPESHKKKIKWMYEGMAAEADQGVSIEENQVKMIYENALELMYSQFEENSDEINPFYNIPFYVKELDKMSIEEAMTDLLSSPGIFEINRETKDIIIRGLLFMLRESFNGDSESLDTTQIVCFRCIAVILDNRLYDKIIYSIKY